MLANFLLHSHTWPLILILVTLFVNISFIKRRNRELSQKQEKLREILAQMGANFSLI